MTETTVTLESNGTIHHDDEKVTWQWVARHVGTWLVLYFVLGFLFTLGISFGIEHWCWWTDGLACLGGDFLAAFIAVLLTPETICRFYCARKAANQ